MAKRLTVPEICAYLDIERSEWDKLSPRDKADLRAGISDGSFAY